jgi:hypothetical protein
VPDPAGARDRLVHEQRRIVHQYVDAAEHSGRFFNQGRDCGRITEIGGDHAMPLTRQPGQYFVSPVHRTPAVQDDPIPGGRERLGHLRSDAA